MEIIKSSLRDSKERNSQYIKGFKMKRILIIVFMLTMADLCAMRQTMNIGGQAIDVQDLQRTLTEAQRNGQEAFQGQLRNINFDISAFEEQQAQLAINLATKRITQAEYDVRIKQLDRRLEARQKDIEALNKQSEKISEVMTSIVSQGATLLIDTMKDESTRKTHIAVAAASAAAGQEVKNRGDLEQLQLKNAQDLTLMREKIQALTSPEFMYRTGGTVAAAGAGLIITYYGAKFGSEYAQRFIGMPTLVRESSEKSMWASLMSLVTGAAKETFGNIVLPAAIKASVERVSASTKTIAQHNAKSAKDKQIPHRGVLLYGPPGTGKTMIAKAIARDSRIPYAIMSGSDFAQFEEGEDVHQFNLLMDWAELRGAIIFFDEVDGFLLKRELLDQRGRKLLLGFLARTGGKSNVKIFIATNRPKDLDTAVLSRMSERIKVGLPDLEARITLLQQYLYMYYGPGNTTGISISPEINDTSLKALAMRLDKFSGREIEDIAGLVQDQLVSSKQVIVTLAIINAAADEKIKQSRDVDAYQEDGFSDSFDPLKATHGVLNNPAIDG